MLMVWHLRDGETASQQAAREFRIWEKTGVIRKTGMDAKNWRNWESRNGCEKLAQLGKPEWLEKTGAIG